jgi:hypothetical protein
MNIIANLIAAADAQRNGKWFSGSSETVEGVGKINCYRDYSIRKAGMPLHFRTTWKLNGKVISQANLINVLASSVNHGAIA